MADGLESREHVIRLDQGVIDNLLMSMKETPPSLRIQEGL